VFKVAQYGKRSLYNTTLPAILPIFVRHAPIKLLVWQTDGQNSHRYTASAYHAARKHMIPEAWKSSRSRGQGYSFT